MMRAPNPRRTERTTSLTAREGITEVLVNGAKTLTF
jgi:hypothetical protein